MKQKGFTLIELMLVVVIIGIIAAIAIPMVTDGGIKARRAIVKGVLSDVRSKQEEFFINNKGYAAGLGNLGFASPLYIDDHGKSVPQADSYYEISMVSTSIDYTISATPLNSQEKDTDCGILSLVNTGAKTASGTKGSSFCW